MKKFTKLFFASLMALTIVTSCNNNGNGSSQPEGPVDYAATLKLDMNSGSAKQEVTVKNYVDGDTTHFHFTIPEDKSINVSDSNNESCLCVLIISSNPK